MIENRVSPWFDIFWVETIDLNIRLICFHRLYFVYMIVHSVQENSKEKIEMFKNVRMKNWKKQEIFKK
jgi:hypothetical protein